MPNLYARTLKRAAQVVGGPEQLALSLKVTPSHLALWLKGMADVPADVFLKAVDLINEHDAPNTQPNPAANTQAELKP